MESFLLSIERNNNDYVPIDWTLSPLYEGKSIYNLENIDNLTKNYSSEQLKKQFFEDGLIDEEYIEKELVIIYMEKDKRKKLRQGVIFEENKDAVSVDYIYQTISTNINNKQFLNEIYNFFKGKGKDKRYSSELESILECISESDHLTSIHLQKIYEIPYIEKRILGLLLKTQIIPRLNNGEKPISLRKEQIW